VDVVVEVREEVAEFGLWYRLGRLRRRRAVDVLVDPTERAD
jgi:hypothetical protein